MSESKYVLYFHCTLYKDSSAGVVTVHKIIDHFNNNDQPAFIILQNETIGAEGYQMPDFNSGLTTPLLTENELNSHIKKGLIPIVFYPDTINDNPLKSNNICRMIFYYDGIYSGKSSLNASADEGIIFFSKQIQENANVNDALFQHIISFPVAKAEIVNYKNEKNYNKNKIYFYDGKFSKNFGGIIPKEINVHNKIDRGEKNSLSQEHIFKQLKEAKLLHVFEDSAIIYEALLLGCPVNIHPDGNFYKNKPLACNEVNLPGSMSKRNPSEDDIKAAMREIIYFKEEYKKWCKTGDSQIVDLNKNFKYYSYKFNQEHIKKIEKNIKQSFKYIDKYIFEKNNLSFFTAIKNIVIKFFIYFLYNIYKFFIKTNFGKNYLKKYCIIFYYKLPTNLKKLITNNIAKIKS